MKVTHCGKLKKLPKKIRKLLEKGENVGMDGVSLKKNSVQIAHERRLARQYGR